MLAWAVAAHEYHASLAEVELNAESGRLEVALRVIPEDFEAVLGAKLGRSVRLEAADVDSVIAEYLESRFLVAGESRTPQPIVWVGKEVSHQAAWLYFEIPVESGEGWTLDNRVLLEHDSSQINTVLFRAGDKQATWTFTVDSEPVELP